MREFLRLKYLQDRHKICLYNLVWGFKHDRYEKYENMKKFSSMKALPRVQIFLEKLENCQQYLLKKLWMILMRYSII